MITDELMDFIRARNAEGMSRDDVGHMLIAEGEWDLSDVDEAYRALGLFSTAPPPAPVSHVEPPFESQTPVFPPEPELKPEIKVISPPRPTSVSVPAPTPAPVSITPVRVEPPPVFQTPHPAPLPQPRVILEPTVPMVSQTVSPAATPRVEAKVEEVSPLPRVLLPDHVAALQPSISPSPTTPSSLPLPPITPPVPLGVFPVASPAPVLPLPATPPSLVSPPASSSSFVRTRSLEEILAPVTAPSTAPLHEKTKEVVLPSMPTPSTSPTPPVASSGEQTAASKMPSGQSRGAPVKLNLAALHLGETKTEETKMPPQEMPKAPTSVLPPREESVRFEKPAEDKSIAATWLMGGKPTPTATLPPLHALPTKRTMGSDMLLREGPSPAPLPAGASSSNEERTKEEQALRVSSPLVPVSRSPETKAKSPAQKAAFTRILKIAIIAILSLLLLGGGLFLFLQLRGGGGSALFSAAMNQFLDLTAFGYQTTATADLTLLTATDGTPRNGSVKFALDARGSLENSAKGYGDGIHHLTFEGGLQSGNFSWSTKLETDLRLIASALYVRVLSFPAESAVDPEIFKTYWLKINIEEIATELALSGVAAAQEGYGSFGGGSEETTFNALVKKHFPFTGGKKLADETMGSVTAHHFRFASDPDRMLELGSALYRKYTNKDLLLDKDQELRLKDAFEKIESEVWIDAATGALLQFSLHGTFDDDMIGVRVKGPIALSITFVDFNKPVTILPPTPILTLDELRVRIDDYKKVLEKRRKDTPKVEQLYLIKDALEEYRGTKGRYPNLLSELLGAKLGEATKLDTSVLKEYFYSAYITPTTLTRTGRCAVKASTCAFYHLGTNFEDATHPALYDDADYMTEVHGVDTKGCADEPDVACFDIIAPLAP